jgi:hypothetical protein
LTTSVVVVADVVAAPHDAARFLRRRCEVLWCYICTWNDSDICVRAQAQHELASHGVALRTCCSSVVAAAENRMCPAFSAHIDAAASVARKRSREAAAASPTSLPHRESSTSRCVYT